MKRSVLVAALCLTVVAPAAADEARLTFDPAFGLRLVKKGVNAAPVAPATQDSLVFTLPVRSKRAGVIRTKGGFTLDDPADDVHIELTRIRFAITGRRLEMSGYALIDGTGYDRFAFAEGRTDKAGRRAALRLNGVAVAALNSQLATTEFEEGEKIGSLALRVSGRG